MVSFTSAVIFASAGMVTPAGQPLTALSHFTGTENLMFEYVVKDKISVLPVAPAYSHSVFSGRVEMITRLAAVHAWMALVPVPIIIFMAGEAPPRFLRGSLRCRPRQF